MTTTNDRQQQLNKFIALKKQQATKAKQDVVSKAAKEIVKAELAAVNKKYDMSFDEEEECLIVKNNKTKEVVKISHSPFMYHLSKMITKSGYNLDGQQQDYVAAMAILHSRETDVVKSEQLAKEVFQQIMGL